MRSIPLASAFAFALFAASPALAGTSQTEQTQSAMQTPAKAGPVVDPNSMKSLSRNNLNQQLRDELVKSGFTSIKIIPSSFYVQAKDKKGEPVSMVIGPDTFTEVTEISNQSGDTQKTPEKPAESGSQNSK